MPSAAWSCVQGACPASHSPWLLGEPSRKVVGWAIPTRSWACFCVPLKPTISQSFLEHCIFVTRSSFSKVAETLLSVQKLLKGKEERQMYRYLGISLVQASFLKKTRQVEGKKEIARAIGVQQFEIISSQKYRGKSLHVYASCCYKFFFSCFLPWFCCTIKLMSHLLSSNSVLKQLSRT